MGTDGSPSALSSATSATTSTTVSTRTPAELSDKDFLALKTSLQTFVETHLPLGRAMGIDVHHYDAQSLSLLAPLPLNNNDKGTAFGGSLYCVAVMTCWSSLYLRCLEERLLDPSIPAGTPNIVVSKAEIEYLAPVKSDNIIASCSTADEDLWQSFFARFKSHGSAKIQLSSTVHTEENGGGKVAVTFSGTYALIGHY